MDKHQQIAQWLLARLGALPITFNDGGHAPVVAKWLEDIADGTLEVTESSVSL
jgi:hypothetical protein